MSRRRVRRSADFVEQAKQLFPEHGSSEGRPRFKVFEEGPLRGAETAFALAFEEQRQPIEGVGSIRYVMVPPTSFFAPLLISACLLRDDTVEIVSVVEDDGYWELIGNDPSD